MAHQELVDLVDPAAQVVPLVVLLEVSSQEKVERRVERQLHQHPLPAVVSAREESCYQHVT